MKKIKFAKTHFGIEDIKAKQPDWTEEECAEWLADHERAILDVMISSANEYIENNI